MPLLAQHPYRGDFADNDLPNVSGSSVQDRSLQAGDMVSVNGGAYAVRCDDPTVGSAVWTRLVVNTTDSNAEEWVTPSSTLRLAPTSLLQIASATVTSASGTWWTQLTDATSTFQFRDPSGVGQRLITPYGDSYARNRNGLKESFIGGITNTTALELTGTGTPAIAATNMDGGGSALTTSTGSSDSAIVFSKTGCLFLYRQGEAFMQGAISILSNVNNRIVMWGIADAATPATNYSIFRYESGVNSGNWQCITNGTATNTSVPATTSGTRLVIQESASNVRFYINDVEVANRTTSLPSTNSARGPLVATINKTSSSTGLWLHGFSAYSEHR